MRQLVAMLAVLALVPAVSACAGDDEEPSLTTVAVETTETTATTEDEAGRWPGPPQGSPDGTVSVTGFNDHVSGVADSWTRSPLLAAAEFLRLDRVQASRTSVVANARGEGMSTRVAVTLNGLADDSVQAQRYVLAFERTDNGKVELVSAEWSQRCARGRGQRKFEPQPCV